MSPYEVRLLIEIDVGLIPLTPFKNELFCDTIRYFLAKEFIEPANDHQHNWKTTKLGRAVCDRFYAVDESGIKFCGECGRLLGE